MILKKEKNKNYRKHLYKNTSNKSTIKWVLKMCFTLFLVEMFSTEMFMGVIILVITDATIILTFVRCGIDKKKTNEPLFLSLSDVNKWKKLQAKGLNLGLALQKGWGTAQSYTFLYIMSKQNKYIFL